MKSSVVIEISGGALVSAYSNSDIELILVDYDEFDGAPSSAVVIPDKSSEMPAELKRLAVDAIERV